MNPSLNDQSTLIHTYFGSKKVPALIWLAEFTVLLKVVQTVLTSHYPVINLGLNTLPSLGRFLAGLQVLLLFLSFQELLSRNRYRVTNTDKKSSTYQNYIFYLLFGGRLDSTRLCSVVEVINLRYIEVLSSTFLL